MTFMYRGAQVMIPRFVSVPFEFTPRGEWGPYVQSMISNTEPWERREDPIETEHFNASILPAAALVDGQEIVWGVHRKHKAKRPQLSPFLNQHFEVPRELIGFITIELSGTPERPRLVRAYAGEYKPPLPWMASAVDAEGGKTACREYWKTHAYCNRRNNLIREGSRTTQAPNWYLRS